MGYRYELFIDDLPVWGLVGPPPEETKGDSNVYIYTHKAFEIAYNGDKVCLFSEVHVSKTSTGLTTDH